MNRATTRPIVQRLVQRPAGLVAGCLVVLATFTGHNAASSTHGAGDTTWTTYQSLGLLEDRTLTLTRWEDVLDRLPGHHWEPNDEGAPIYNFPWGTAVVAAPVIGVFAAGAALTGGSLEERLRTDVPPLELENTVASVFVALTAGLLYLIARRELRSPLTASVVALSFAFATSAFSTASRALWPHGPAMLLITAEVALLVRARTRPGVPGRDRLLPLLGPMFVLAYAVRPTTAVVAVALTGVVAVAHRRRLPGLIAGGAVTGALFLAVNLATYQALQPNYYDAGRLTGSGTFLEGLAGNLISPQRGMLVWSPIVVLAGAGAVVAWRRRTFNALTGGLVAAVGLYWVVISTLDPWWAGFSTGPRLFTDVLPILTVLSLPAVDALRRSGWAPQVGVAVLLAVSLAINYRGATRFETQLWNATPVDVHQHPDRMWDWGDLQFLR